MKLYILSSYLENLLLIGLLFRIFYYLTKQKTIKYTSIEILMYIILFFIAKLLIFSIPKEHITFNFIHICIPTMFTISLLPFPRIAIFKIFIFILISVFNFIYINDFAIKTTYTLSIILLIYKGISKTRNDLSDAPYYLFLSFDQLLTFIIYLMSSLHFNWHNSEYLKYFSTLTYIVFPLTLLFTHVKLRRFIFK